MWTLYRRTRCSNSVSFPWQQQCDFSTPHRLISAPRQRVVLRHKHHSLVRAAPRCASLQVRSPPHPPIHPPSTSSNVGHIQLLWELFAWLSPLITSPITQHLQLGVVNKAVPSCVLATQRWPERWNVTWSYRLLMLSCRKQNAERRALLNVSCSEIIFSLTTYKERSGWMIWLQHLKRTRWLKKQLSAHIIQIFSISLYGGG